MPLSISWTTETLAFAEGGDLTSDVAEHTLVFDAVTKEAHEWSATLTEHAVENGAVLSDHKLVNGDMISLEVNVTNTPLSAPPPSGYGQGQPVTAASEKGQNAPATVITFSQEFDRVGDVMYTLRRLVVEPTLVTISTAKRTYPQMSIVSVSVPRDSPDGGDAFTFNIEAVAVRVAETQVVDSPEPREPRGRADQNTGSQESEEEGGGASGGNQSLLSQARSAYEEGGIAAIRGLVGAN